MLFVRQLHYSIPDRIQRTMNITKDGFEFSSSAAKKQRVSFETMINNYYFQSTTALCWNTRAECCFHFVSKLTPNFVAKARPANWNIYNDISNNVIDIHFFRPWTNLNQLDERSNSNKWNLTRKRNGNHSLCSIVNDSVPNWQCFEK